MLWPAALRQVATAGWVTVSYRRSPAHGPLVIADARGTLTQPPHGPRDLYGVQQSGGPGGSGSAQQTGRKVRVEAELGRKELTGVGGTERALGRALSRPRSEMCRS